MSHKYSKKDYGMLIGRIREEHTKNPRRAEKEAYRLLYKDNKINIKGVTKFLNNLGTVCLIFLLVFLLFGKYNALLGLAGLAFFSAMLLVLKEPQSNSIIFVFSHGLTGYAMMNGEMIYNMISSPILSDGISTIFILLIVAVILLIAGVTYAVLYCLSDDLQLNPINKNIPTLLATLSTIVIHLTFIFLI
jgi:hypothetical protein